MGATLPNDLTPRVAVLEEIARGTQAALERIGQRLEHADTRLDARVEKSESRMDARLASMDTRLSTMDSRIDANTRWSVGIMLGTFATLLTLGIGLLGAMARGFHWI